LRGSVVTIYRSDRTRRAVDAEQTYNRPYEGEIEFVDTAGGRACEDDGPDSDVLDPPDRLDLDVRVENG